MPKSSKAYRKRKTIPKSVLKTWWEECIFKELSDNIYQLSSVEILDKIDTSLRKNFIGWNTPED